MACCLPFRVWRLSPSWLRHRVRREWNGRSLSLADGVTRRPAGRRGGRCAGTGDALRDPGGDRARVRGGAPASPPTPTRRARASRRARLQYVKRQSARSSATVRESAAPRSGSYPRGPTAGPRLAVICPTSRQRSRPYGLIVLTLDRDRLSAITWFGDS